MEKKVKCLECENVYNENDLQQYTTHDVRCPNCHAIQSSLVDKYEISTKCRDGKPLYIGDIVETVQGTKFEIISFLGTPCLKDKNGELFDLEMYMSPNIWLIGEVENPTFI